MEPTQFATVEAIYLDRHEEIVGFTVMFYL